MTRTDEEGRRHRVIRNAILLALAAILVYGTLDLPPFGDPSDPIHHHVADRYLEESEHEIGVPNVVTSVLASYRGYDTLGETTVVFTAAVGVMILLSALRRKDEFGEEAWGEEDIPELKPEFVHMYWLDKDGNPKPGAEEPQGGEE